ncbi:MAG: Gfo/Idh/MocA family protein [Prolixibacteraceae bacterium]
MSTTKKNDISRRSFIEKSTLLGMAGLVGASLISTSCKKTKTNEELGLPALLAQAPDGKKLKVGLVGCGNRGTGALLNFLDAGPNLEAVALADVFEDKTLDCLNKLKERQISIDPKNCYSGFDAYKRLLESDVDVVILATPPHFRPQYLNECIIAKKHVFMEKPACVDPVGARSIIASSKKAAALGLCIVTGTQRRHQKNYIETYKQVASGAIGDLVSARAWWLQTHVWFRSRQEGWSDMEYMIRNWNNFCWLCGDHILDTHVHNIDIINWFMGKHPESAVGMGGRARRLTGDQYDFFSIDFDYGGGVHSQSMSRQIDDCANSRGEMIMGTEGYTNCENTIFNLDGTVKWRYDDSNDISPYVQEHIDFVTAIRTNQPVQEAEQTAISTLTAIMGRTAAYTGNKITWDEMMESSMKLGPEEYVLGPVDMKFEVPIPGSQHKL